MDPEQTFLRVHARLSGMLSQLLTPRIRLVLEYMYLAVAVTLFCMLVVMHTNFVQQPGCTREFSGVEFGEAQLVQIKIVSEGLWGPSTVGQSSYSTSWDFSKNSIAPAINSDRFTVLTTKFWSSWVGLGARSGKLIFKSWNKGVSEHQPDNVGEMTDMKGAMEGSQWHPLSAKESSTFYHLLKEWYMRLVAYWKHAKQLTMSTLLFMGSSNWNDLVDNLKGLKFPRMENVFSVIVQWFEKRSRAFEPTYLYAVEKGYFLLSEGAKNRHDVRAINVTISAQNSCFGNMWQQRLINIVVGYDTILTNSLLNYPGHGYLYNFQTKEFYDLSYGHEPAATPARFGDYIVTKCGVLIMSLIVFFTTTMSVSFTLRETQSRMLKFTVQLQYHARHQLPTFQLIFVHVIESLVFVPIMIGILFFLFEFYDDQLLAFLVLTLVWLCELFTMISARTPISMQFFPRFFLLYFLVFHIYFFSYAYGFSYLAFAATAAFMQHLILYFWNRFEVPALQRFIRSQAQLHPQAGVQITQSTIYTSTLHIARVNMRDPVAVNDNITAAREALGDPAVPRTNHAAPGEPNAAQPPDAAATNPIHFPHHDLQDVQNAAPTGSNMFNPLSSLMLWLSGGGVTDGIVSFFSLFRDAPDQPQDQDFREPHRDENEQVT